MLNPFPQISVVMPVYNSQHYLGKAVESILDQSHRNFEFLIFDDGSTDSSRELLKKYEAQDPRIKLFLRDHGGLTPLLNEGIQKARGNFIARMDSDDIAMPNRFETQLKYLVEHSDCVAVGSEVLRIDPDGWPIGIWGQASEHELIEERFLNGRGGAIIHPSAMFPRSALEKVGGYNPSCEPAEDLDLFIRLAETGKLANIPQVLLKYREHFGGVTQKRRDEQVRVVRNIVTQAWQNYGKGLPPDRLFKNSKILTTIEKRERWATTAFKQGHYLTSLKHSCVVLSQKPYSIPTWKRATKSLLKVSFAKV